VYKSILSEKRLIDSENVRKWEFTRNRTTGIRNRKETVMELSEEEGDLRMNEKQKLKEKIEDSIDNCNFLSFELERLLELIEEKVI
jgi:DNA-binding transcriptional regulator YhcF (GntR family)